MFSNRDSWLTDYDMVVQLGAKIGAKIRERDEHERGSLQRNKLDSVVDKMVPDFQRKLQGLKTSLHKLSTSRQLTELEYEKRKEMLLELSEKYKQLDKAKSRGWAPSYQAVDGAGADSWGGRGGGGGGGGGGAGPGTGHRMTPGDIKMQQQAILAEQDRGLDQLSLALRRQQQVGLTIQEEVEEQNVLIDDIQRGTVKANMKVRTQTRRIADVRRQDSCRCTCLLWTIIIVLFILILIVAFVKFDGKPGY